MTQTSGDNKQPAVASQPGKRYAEIVLPAWFNDDEHVVLEHIEEASESSTVSRTDLALQVEVLTSLVAQVTEAGGISHLEFSRLGGWLERATAVLPDAVIAAVPTCHTTSKDVTPGQLEAKLSEEVIREFLTDRIESGDMQMEDITLMMVRYGLMDPKSFQEEMNERIQAFNAEQG